MQRHFLAFDLGAGSGRAVLGSLHNQRLVLAELHRFANHPLELLGHLYWDYIRLYEEMKEGMRRCVESGQWPDGIAVDTWGVDCAFVAADGSIAGLPCSYRDGRTEGAMEQLFGRIPRERVYALTGIQFLRFNTLFQLYALVRDGAAPVQNAARLLFMPDLFSYLFTGVPGTEYTIATTSQLYNPVTGQWERELLDTVGVQPTLMQRIVQPGTTIGLLRDAVAHETGLGGVPVIATASHDTAAAIAAVPAEGEEWAYISSGTWSLMGMELRQPVISAEALRMNFTNEGGVGGSIRFLKNITGLWLLQECKRRWDKDRVRGYEELMMMAATAETFRTLIDPDAPEFLNPPDMPQALCSYAARTGQPAPLSVPQAVRAVLEGLALKYRYVLEQLRVLSARPITRIHVIGGGVQNKVLCQCTADATQLPVIAGPVEATSMGNILVQALGTGHLRSVEEIRQVVRNSCAVTSYAPHASTGWDGAYERFRKLVDA